MPAKSRKRPRPEDELEEFALPAHSYGRMTGASLAVHAVPDAFMVLHTGVGCKYKGAGQYCLHDLGRPSHHREGYTEVTDMALIKGSAARIPVYIRSWYKKRRPAFMGVVSSTFLEMAGEDFAKAVKDGAKTVPCDVAYLKTPGFEGDLYDGYSQVVREIVARSPFKKTPPVKGRVGIVGYPFDRYEMDHAGNLQQLRFLLEQLGLEPGPVLLSGRPYGELREIASCEHLVALPYARHFLPELKKLSGRSVVSTDLPIGLSGTFRWLQDVGKACGVPAERVQRAIRAQSEYARPQVDAFRNYVRQRIGGGRLALFAETPLAAGLASLMCEVSLSPRLVGLRDRSLGGEKALRESLDRAGVKPPGDMEVVEDPSLEKAQRRVLELRDRGQLSMLMASHTEIQAVNPQGGPGGIPSIEIGFPSVTYHVLYPTPHYGVAGALALAQRIMNLVR